MAGRPGRRRLDHSSPLVDLDSVFADDALIDDIASRPWQPAVHHRFAAGRGAGVHSAAWPPTDPVADIFQTWREELAARPLPPQQSVRQVAAVLERSQQRPRHRPRHRAPSRSLRPALSVAAAIAALVVGSTTVGSKDAEPGSPLWGITQVLWPDLAESAASRYEVRNALTDARAALQAGNSKDAKQALLRATAGLDDVEDADARDVMQQTVDELWVQVRATDPGTTSAAPADTEVDGPATTAGSAASTTASATGTSTPAAQLAAAPPDIDSATAVDQDAGTLLAGPAIAAPPNPSVTRPTEPPTDSATDSPTAPAVTEPADPGTALDAPTVSSSPSTVPPPPSVPIAPSTPTLPSQEPISQSAPAQSPPMPTPSSPAASGEDDSPPATTPSTPTTGATDTASTSTSSSALAGAEATS